VKPLRIEGEVVIMGLKWYAAGACAVAFGMLALAGPPAEAAPKKKAVTNPSHVVASRPRTRVRVERRSFLDGGTEVLPGERKFTDYAFPPGTSGSPASMIGYENTAFDRGRSPLLGPFDLPGRRNPWPWNWCVGC
jgi:hypothetical protein